MVDSGYPNIPGFLSPYRGERYHISAFNQGDPTKVEEWFNKRHSSLRNVIERCFGVLKARFPILRRMPHGLSLKTQKYIPVACCTLHNFIRLHDVDDRYLNIGAAEGFDPDEPTIGTPSNDVVNEIQVSQEALNAMAEIRNRIARKILLHERRIRRAANDE